MSRLRAHPALSGVLNLRRRQISAAIAGPVTFGLIPQEHWYQPDWIDEEKASASRDDMVANNVIYGGASRYAFAIWSLLIASACRQCIVRIDSSAPPYRALLTCRTDIAICVVSTLV